MFRFKNLVAAVFCRNCYRGCPGKRLVGPYAGFKIRQNWSDASGEITKSSHTPTFPGEMAGYNFDIGNFIVGPEVFADMHHGSTTYKDAGDGIKFGMPSWVFAIQSPGVDGLGLEYKLATRWSVVGEWTMDKSSHDNTTRTNNSVTIGVHYYFEP